MGNTIYASFADSALAEKAAGALLDHGAKNEDISIVTSHTEEIRYDTEGMPFNEGTAVEPPPVVDPAWSATEASRPVEEIDLASRDASIIESPSYSTPPIHGDDVYTSEADSAAKQGITTTTGADAGAGAAKGAGWGLGIGALAALAAIFVPGVGLVIGGGTLAMALGGVAAATGAGAAAGAVTGYLKDQGIDTEVAQQYENAVAHGGALIALAVPSGDVGEAEAKDILTKYGALNVNAYVVANRGYVA